jgi:thiol-disulfide isomerase/thioredoxin
MPTILETLKHNRPTLSDSSLKTYNSILSNLYKKIFSDKELDLAKFNEHKKFISFLKNMEGSKRKTYLSALVVLCPNCDEYKELMNKDGQEYNAQKKLQKRTPKEEENWVGQDELMSIYDAIETDAKKLMKMKNHTPQDIQKIQPYIILSLVSGKYIPIRRSLDWTEMVFKGEDKEKDNFLDKGKKQYKFYFNIYKTQKYLNDQETILPAPLKKIISDWIKLIEKVYPENKYLLIDSNGNKLTPTKMTQRLNNIFGKKASINILRHSFITEKYKDIPALGELQEEATAMGHSLKEHLEYIKK